MAVVIDEIIWDHIHSSLVRSSLVWSSLVQSGWSSPKKIIWSPCCSGKGEGGCKEDCVQGGWNYGGWEHEQSGAGCWREVAADGGVAVGKLASPAKKKQQPTSMSEEEELEESE